MAATPALLYVHQLLLEICLGVMGFLLESEFLHLFACREGKMLQSGHHYNTQEVSISARNINEEPNEEPNVYTNEGSCI